MTETPLAPSAIDASVDHGVPNHTATGIDHLTSDYDAVLLASFGGPNGQDDVIPFLRNVTRGRGIPDERLEAVSGHYRALGGVSPINEQNIALRDALQAEIDRRGLGLPVIWGNRNWEPYLTDVVRAAVAEGRHTLLGLATSAYSSYSGCRQYREDFGATVQEIGGTDLTIDKLRHYFNTEGFLAPVLDGAVAGVREMLEAGHAAEDILVMYSTHSVPDVMATSSGPEDTRTPGSGGWYVAQHQAAIAWVHDQLQEALGTAVPQQFVFQSRSGNPAQPWLEPDINDAIETAAEDGVKAIVCVPIGFISDHVEVIWDLDTEARQTAADLGLAFVRTPTSGTDPRFVSALVDLVEERLGRRDPVETVTSFPATPDVCGIACCQGMRDKPTTAGVDS
ncbi:ferrochelatase [Aestuariimicrobium sp. p3-SID1156]|uniref:ferrochelatase n=1 Tax=Aestuariimicrobium sp. p3-SID1156 TaxID=2916038 RepID=UPI0021F0899F|nr:ferrochelatase [Aestuariimicrobium sp. p3-SID1156]MCT1458097.1 ferrochelatase [Aestuariimicrobium sp. p3-SID1156]